MAVLSMSCSSTFLFIAVGEEQDDDDEAENIGAAAMYEDFFGPRRGN